MAIVTTRREALTTIQIIRDYLESYRVGIHDPVVVMLKRALRKYWAAKEDKLKSICGNLHFRYDEDGMGMTDYTILPGQCWSEEEIREFIEENWIRIYSMYDCTGKQFTVDLHVRNVPAGVLIIHNKSIDV